MTMQWFTGNRDRRKGKRLRVELSACFQVMCLGRQEPLTDWEPAKALDLSAGGLSLACEKLSPGGVSLVRCLDQDGPEFLRVRLNADELSWELDCRLVWANREEDGPEPPCRLGLVLIGGSHPPGWKKLVG